MQMQAFSCGVRALCDTFYIFRADKRNFAGKRVRAQLNGVMELPALLRLSPVHLRDLILKKWVPVPAICALACTCTHMRDVIHRDKHLWHHQFVQRFPGTLAMAEGLKGLRDWRERFITFYLLTCNFISKFGLQDSLHEASAIDRAYLAGLGPGSHDDVIAFFQTELYQEGIWALPSGAFAYRSTRARHYTAPSLARLLSELVRASRDRPHPGLVVLRMFKYAQLMEFITLQPLQATLKLNPAETRSELLEEALSRRWRKVAHVAVCDITGHRHFTIDVEVSRLSLELWLIALQEELLHRLGKAAHLGTLRLTYADGAPVDFNLRLLEHGASLVCTYGGVGSAKKEEVAEDGGEGSSRKPKHKGGKEHRRF